MTAIDTAVLASLRELVTETHDHETRFRGTMFFTDELLGPPGRVHGGIHPLVRTLPILARLRGDAGAPTRVRIDAALQKGLPIGDLVEFDGTYRDENGGFRLETRFLGSERLRATATVPTAADLPQGEALERWRLLFEKAQKEEERTMRVIGVKYHLTDSLVWLDLRTFDEVDADAHLRRALLPNGGVGLAALSTQLDAIGATGRGARMRHPHFTKHITLSFDLEGLEPGTPLLLLADRTTIVEDETSEKVEIKGERFGTATVEVAAVDADFRRCFCHGFVTAHPVDPERFAGFEEMRKLRQP
ncbi:MAG: hypothetical protein U0230_20510 [Polyangiales bacterium]